MLSIIASSLMIFGLAKAEDAEQKQREEQETKEPETGDENTEPNL